MSIEIINVSTKGQVVLPAEMRQKLDINVGDKLLVYCGEDSILIKKVSMPSKEEFESSIEKNMKMAKAAGLTEQDVLDAVKESRRERRKNANSN